MAHSARNVRSAAAALLVVAALSGCVSDGLEPDFTIATTDREPPATDTRTSNPPTEIPATTDSTATTGP